MAENCEEVHAELDRLRRIVADAVAILSADDLDGAAALVILEEADRG